MIEFISPCTGTLASEQQTRRHSEARCSHSCRHSQSQSYTNLQLNKTGRGVWKNTKGQEHRSNVAEQSDRQTAASFILVFYFPHHLLSQRRLKKIMFVSFTSSQTQEPRSCYISLQGVCAATDRLSGGLHCRGRALSPRSQSLLLRP